MGPGPASDSLVNVEILPGVRKLEFRKVDDSTQLTILAGTVKLKQGTALFFCDSCVTNKKIKVNSTEKPESGMGIENTMKRLQLVYPGRHSIRMDDNDKSFAVELNIQLES